MRLASAMWRLRRVVNRRAEAADAYRKSLDIYQDMKNKGTLSGADAGKPDEIAKEIAKCDAASKISS